MEGEEHSMATEDSHVHAEEKAQDEEKEIEDKMEKDVEEEHVGTKEKHITFEGEGEPKKYIKIDLPQKDKDGNEVMARVTVPVLSEKKERKFKMVKRKRLVPKTVIKDDKEVEEEVEEEYEACMLVETVTQRIQIREAKEGGEVELREEDYVQEFYLGKERKCNVVKVEKTMEDGRIEQVEELVVEEESEDEIKKKKKKRLRRRKRKGSSQSDEGFDWKWEWVEEGEEEDLGEEFSEIEQEFYQWQPSEEEFQQEEVGFQYEDWGDIEERFEEGIEEEEEKIPKETSWEREQKRQRASFYKLMELFLKEIRRRKVLMKDIKLFCRMSDIEVKSPGKEFEKNPQMYIDEEAAEVDALFKHLDKVFNEYKEEEKSYQEQITELKSDVDKNLNEFKQYLLEMMQMCDQSQLKSVSKGRNLMKLIDDVFKYEEMLSKEYVKKAIYTLNIEQIKYMLFTETEEEKIDKNKEEEGDVESFNLEKAVTDIKNVALGAQDDQMKSEKERLKFIKLMENVICKRREMEYVKEKDEEFLRMKPIIEEDLKQREETYWKLRKYVKDWRKADHKARRDNIEERFPAILLNEKKQHLEWLSLQKTLNKLKHTCPNMVELKHLPKSDSSSEENICEL